MQTAPLSKPVRLLVSLLSTGVGLSALVGLGLMLRTPKPSWFFVEFEVVIVAAAIFGVFLGMGRFREAPALTLVCIAGAIGFGSLLGYLGAAKALLGVSLTPWLYARVGASVALAAVAGLNVLARHPGRSLPALSRGVIFGTVFVGVVAGGWVASKQLASANAPGAVKLIAFLLVSSIALGLIAAAVHYLVKAFAAGRLDALPETPPKPGTPT